MEQKAAPDSSQNDSTWQLNPIAQSQPTISKMAHLFNKVQLYRDDSTGANGHGAIVIEPDGLIVCNYAILPKGCNRSAETTVL